MEEAESFVATTYNETLSLTTFGKSVTEPGHSWGPDIRSYYLIHYVVSGRGTFQTFGSNAKKYELRAGQGFLIEPCMVTRYESDAHEPWSYMWVGFSGKAAPSIISSLGINQNSPIFSCTQEQGRQLAGCIEKMLKYKDNSPTSTFRQMESFYGFVSLLTESIREPVPAESSNDYVSQCIEYIKAHLSEPFTVQDLADYLRLNRSYLTLLFKNNLDMSPHDYIVQCRLNQACRLLESTQLSIENIACQCGYVTGNSFTKSFQKKLLMSPSAYRQYCQSNHNYPNPEEQERGKDKKLILPNRTYLNFD